MLMAPQLQHPAFSAAAFQRQMWMNSNLMNYRPRPRLQYTQSQIDAAIHDVTTGKSISKAAKDHGVPFTSLYRKIKVKPRSSFSPSSTQQFDEDAPNGAPESLDDGAQNSLRSISEEVDLPISFDSVYPSLQAEDSNPDNKTFSEHSVSPKNQYQLRSSDYHTDNLSVENHNRRRGASVGDDESKAAGKREDVNETEESYFPEIEDPVSLHL